MITNFCYIERAYVALSTARDLMQTYGYVSTPICHRLRGGYYACNPSSSKIWRLYRLQEAQAVKQSCIHNN